MKDIKIHIRRLENEVELMRKNKKTDTNESIRRREEAIKYIKNENNPRINFYELQRKFKFLWCHK